MSISNNLITFYEGVHKHHGNTFFNPIVFSCTYTVVCSVQVILNIFNKLLISSITTHHYDKRWWIQGAPLFSNQQVVGNISQDVLYLNPPMTTRVTPQAKC